MKKVLVLALVMGIASVASAGLEVSVADADLLVGESTTVSISLTGASNIKKYLLGIDLSDATKAELSWDGVTFPLTGFDLAPKTQNTSAADGEITASNLFSPAISVGDPQGVMANLTLTCLAEGNVDVILSVVGSTEIDGTTQTIEEVDRVTVYQTPEPATMALLGLGALVLRRKK